MQHDDLSRRENSGVRPARFAPAAQRRRATSTEHSAAEGIVAAMERLLADAPIEMITVAEVLREAGIARGTFYFWFTSKYDVVAHAHRILGEKIIESAAPWLSNPQSPPAAIDGVLHGLVATYRNHAPILRAASESWRTQPEVRPVWDDIMGGLIERITTFIVDQQRLGIAVQSIDARRAAESLVWMNERALYMASLNVSSTGLDDELAATLSAIWKATLYKGATTSSGRRRHA